MVGHKCFGKRGQGMKGPGSSMFEEMQQLMIGAITELSEKFCGWRFCRYENPLNAGADNEAWNQ